MSAFAPFRSASPPEADLPGGVAESPFLTLSGLAGSKDRVMKSYEIMAVGVDLIL